MHIIKRDTLLRSLLAGVLGLAAMRSAHADFVNVVVQRSITASASAQEYKLNCSPCGQEESPWLITGPYNFKELTGQDSTAGGVGTHDLTLGNQSLSLQADDRGMHAEVLSARKVDFLSPDVISVNVTGHVDVTHPGGEDLLRDKGMVMAYGSTDTAFSFHVDRPTTVLVTVDMSFKDLGVPVGAVSGGLSGRLTFLDGKTETSYTHADVANGPLSFMATLLPEAGASVQLSVSGSRQAEAAGHGVSEWQANVTIRAVPEPSGWALLSCCVLAGGGILRRDRHIRRDQAQGGLAVARA